jgi:hypothetical protein
MHPRFEKREKALHKRLQFDGDTTALVMTAAGASCCLVALDQAQGSWQYGSLLVLGILNAVWLYAILFRLYRRLAVTERRIRYLEQIVSNLPAAQEYLEDDKRDDASWHPNELRR